MAAANAVLDHIEDGGDALYTALNDRAAALTAELSAIVDAGELPWTVARFGSLWRLQYRGMPNLYQPLSMELLYHHLLTEGVYVWEGRTFFLSTAHDDAAADRLVTAFGRAVRALRGAGFLGPGQEASNGAVTLPATAQQRRLWRVCHRLGEASTAFDESVQVELDGPLDVPALQVAVDTLRARHPALRAHCTDQGRQLVVAPWRPAPLPVVDSVDPDARYDLGRGPLFRPALVRHAPDRHTLRLDGHHLVLDGRSYAILLADLTAAYATARAGGTPDRTEVPWFAADPHQARPEADPHWWTRLARPPLPRWPVATAPAGSGRRTEPVDGAFWRTLTAASAAQGCTPFMLAFLAFGYVLHQVTGQDDLVIGVSVDGRDGGADQGRVGHRSDVLPVRCAIGRDRTFAGYVRTMREPLLADLDPSRRATAPPWDGLTTVVFDLNPPLGMPDWPDLRTRVSLPAHRETAYDLFFDVLPTEPGALVDLSYGPAVGADTAARLAAGWKDVIAALGGAA
jgi:hypothetical protein